MIGIDLVSVSRFIELIEGKYFKRFLGNVFTATEIQAVGDNDKIAMAKQLAGKFAAKEAVIKASGNRLHLKDLRFIEIAGNKGSCTCVVRKDGFEDRFFISISQDNDYAVAVAIIDKGSNSVFR